LLFVSLSECKTPRGVEYSNRHADGAVKDEQMTASTEKHTARWGRREHEHAWCPHEFALGRPQYSKIQFLEIDFLNLQRITAILTQGRATSQFVTKYYLFHAIDRNLFHSYRHGENNEKVVRILFVMMVLFHHFSHPYVLNLMS